MRTFQVHHGRLMGVGAADATKAASATFGIVQQARALAAEGQQMALLVARSAPEEEVFSFYGVARQERFELVQLPALRGRRLSVGALFKVGCLWELRRRLREGPPAVLYLREVKLTRFFLRFRRWLGLPIVLEFHNFRAPDPGLTEDAYRAAEARALRRVDALVTTTQALADAVVRVYGPERKPVPIPLAAEVNERARPLDTTDWGRRTVTLCYLGQLYRLQGVEVAIEALAGLPRCRLLILGGGDEDIARLRTHGSRLGCTDRLEFAGFVPPNRVAHALSGADVLLLPALDRGRMPYAGHQKLYEYLACRRPIVASDLASVREDVTDGETALLVEPGSASAIAQAVKRLLRSPALASRLADAGYALARRFTWQARSARLVEVFEGVLQAGRDGGGGAEG